MLLCIHMTILEIKIIDNGRVYVMHRLVLNTHMDHIDLVSAVGSFNE